MTYYLYLWILFDYFYNSYEDLWQCHDIIMRHYFWSLSKVGAICSVNTYNYVMILWVQMMFYVVPACVSFRYLYDPHEHSWQCYDTIIKNVAIFSQPVCFWSLFHVITVNVALTQQKCYKKSYNAVITA